MPHIARRLPAGRLSRHRVFFPRARTLTPSRGSLSGHIVARADELSPFCTPYPSIFG